eukprot:TRINITY_DN504_c0_g1_i4.p1 TRINITY_DN504_c0_g1~~TRINITY_DN504_c0_g1_i4.p1  ORF type:complete len:470 (-),score=118.86 TRINITY_DN504_c0_g1_i4:424-1758(-)
MENNILNHLDVKIEDGLRTKEIKSRRQTYGQNKFPEKKNLSYLYLLFCAFNDITIMILTVAAIISIILGSVFPAVDPKTGKTDKLGWIEGFAIAMAVLLITNVTAVLNYNKARQFKELAKADVLRAKVRRDGEKIEIDAVEIVVGDIVEIICGDCIPCDGILLTSSNLTVDESSLTGENLPVDKTAVPGGNKLMLSNTMALQGQGKMIATSVGENTLWGSILKDLVEEDTQLTPIQVYINNIARTTGIIGLLAGLTIFFILSIYWAIDTSSLIVQQGWRANMINGLIENFIIAVTIIVVAVPEGLPLAVTITLAYSMRAMLKDMNLVRNLSSCETMGGVNDICSDKTGTLTLNQMTVVKGYLGYEHFFLNDGKVLFSENNFQEKYFADYLYPNIYLNSNTTRQFVDDNEDEETNTKCFCCKKSENFQSKKKRDYWWKPDRNGTC